MIAALLIESLATFPAGLAALVADLTVEQARVRPPAGGWAPVELLGHLIDEERDDFRVRLRSCLNDPEAPWPALDPEGAVPARRWIEHEPRELVERFSAERSDSVIWLRSLGDVDWNQAYRHPQLGRLAAGDLLLSWAAHDVLHLRQLARLRFERLERGASGFSASYAGSW